MEEQEVHENGETRIGSKGRAEQTPTVHSCRRIKLNVEWKSKKGKSPLTTKNGKVHVSMLFKMAGKKKNHFWPKYFTMIDSEQVRKGKVKSTEKLEDEKDSEIFNWQAVIKK